MVIQPNTDMSVTLPGWVGIDTSTVRFVATKAAKHTTYDKRSFGVNVNVNVNVNEISSAPLLKEHGYIVH